MPREVLYRKWRPQRFADVAGQDAATRTLVNALKAGTVSHAYRFSGPRGTGKTTMGRLLTKAVNCESNAAPGAGEGEPCNTCASCVAYAQGRALDLVELDAASNRGIDDIRELRDRVGFAPMAGAGAHKVYLVDEVHMLTDAAFNALLKTLEEPPPYVVFILATTDAHRVPATITSRCQRLEFSRIPTSAIVARLSEIAGAERMTVPAEGLEAIARIATGSLRDAINLLEQIRDSYGDAPSLDAVREALGLVADERAGLLAQHALRGDLAAALGAIGSVRADGLDLRQFQRQAVAHLRNILLLQSGAAPEGTLSDDQVAELRRSLEGVPQAAVIGLLKRLSEADLRLDPLSPLPLELAVAESLQAPAPPAVAQPEGGRPAPRPAAAQSRSAPPPRPAPARPASPPAQPPAPQRRAEPPPEFRRENITGASPEEIARLVGSSAPVIPEAPAAAEDAPLAPPANGGNGGVDLEGFVLKQLYPLVRPRSQSVAAYLNGSCHAVSWQDGVLTLGVYSEFHKEKIELPANRALYEEVAASILGAAVSLRCIMAARPARALSKSPLVQHAVPQHGATIVSEGQE
jgi:DNA polymerase-3 subunit gamma/tau